MRVSIATVWLTLKRAGWSRKQVGMPLVTTVAVPVPVTVSIADRVISSARNEQSSGLKRLETYRGLSGFRNSVQRKRRVAVVSTFNHLSKDDSVGRVSKYYTFEDSGKVCSAEIFKYEGQLQNSAAPQNS